MKQFLISCATAVIFLPSFSYSHESPQPLYGELVKATIVALHGAEGNNRVYDPVNHSIAITDQGDLVEEWAMAIGFPWGSNFKSAAYRVIVTKKHSTKVLEQGDRTASVRVELLGRSLWFEK